MPEIIKLYLAFLKIGAFSFGGGLAMLPFIEGEIIEKHGWLSYNEFLDLLSLSQSSPGPIAINSATFIGYRFGGFQGALFSTLGVISFSILIINLISKYLDTYSSHPKTKLLFKILRPITLGFILSSSFSTFSKSVIDIKSFLIFAVSFFLLIKRKFHPIIIIVFFGIVNIFIK